MKCTGKLVLIGFIVERSNDQERISLRSLDMTLSIFWELSLGDITSHPVKLFNWGNPRGMCRLVEGQRRCKIGHNSFHWNFNSHFMDQPLLSWVVDQESVQSSTWSNVVDRSLNYLIVMHETDHYCIVLGGHPHHSTDPIEFTFAIYIWIIFYSLIKVKLLCFGLMLVCQTTSTA